MNQFNVQLPVGLLAQLVRALHWYRRGQGSNPCKPDFFRLSFRNCIGFIFIFPGYITNQFNVQLPVGLLAQLVRALHWYRRGQGSNPCKADFFRLSFCNCISCVKNCEDPLYTYFFIPQFKYMNFIYS